MNNYLQGTILSFLNFGISGLSFNFDWNSSLAIFTGFVGALISLATVYKYYYEALIKKEELKIKRLESKLKEAEILKKLEHGVE